MAENEVTLELSEHEVIVADDSLAPGTAAGDYTVTDVVASGGWGAVYRAKHRASGREAALKVLHASLAAQPKMVERFAREVQLVNLLRHPNIVEIYDVGLLPSGRPYYAMEYLAGGTLAELLAERGRLSPLEVLDLVEPVCAALEAAHEAGVVHRDVKASNIALGGDPACVKLVDFGIAKLLSPQTEPLGLTSEGRHVGTITIMAPEQLLNGPIGPHTDIYALGVLLYRLLTGTPPFDGRGVVSLARQHLEQPAPRPSERAPLSAALDAIVLRCLEKRPEHRYASAKDLLAALRRVIGDGSRPSRGEQAPMAGVAVYVEIRLRDEVDELDEAASDDIGAVLDLADEALRGSGFLLAISTGSQVLGVRLLPSSIEGARAVREEAIRAAVALRRKLDGRAGAHDLVHVNLCVHAGGVIVRAREPLEILGGPLARASQWAPGEAVAELCATRAAIEGIAGLALAEGPGGLLRVTPRDPRAELEALSV